MNRRLEKRFPIAAGVLAHRSAAIQRALGCPFVTVIYRLFWHAYGTVRSLRSWRQDACEGLGGKRVDLDGLERVVFERVLAWRAAAVQWEIIRWSVTDKPAASLRVQRGSALAELILWASGEAELMYVRDGLDEPVSEHYEITAMLGLSGCVDDLERHIGL